MQRRTGGKVGAEHSSGQRNPVAAAIRANYAAFQYRFVEFLADHLADCSRTFGGDLQQMLVLAVIGQMELNARIRAQSGEAGPAASITASRIADVTGIPRETVRRKLRALAGRDWILQQEDGSWRLRIEDDAAVARNDLKDLNERSIERWATLLVAVKPML